MKMIKNILCKFFEGEISYIKGTENTRVDTLSRKPEYLENKTYPSYAILKAKPDGLVFNTIELTIISRLTGSN